MSLKENDPLEQPPSNRAAIIALSVIAVIIVAIIVVLALKNDNPEDSEPKNTNSTTLNNTSLQTNTNANKNTNVSASTTATKTFTMNGANFEFSDTELRVEKDDRVKITFTSTQGIHDWSLPAFSATTETVSAGGTTSVEFTADRKGTFEFFCSVGDHRALGMTGTLIVE
ncbi:MAG: cupredoxin domain-containing protein [Candidatus Kerfeldbacteria bacterium]|nr:cupredoxin domain-containing protein [Candidatus Kerfeldbacteria bacterium]